MTEKLFVYGTLGPGRPNEHILITIGGIFESAFIKGILREEGWGAEMGYPGLELDANGTKIEGFVFTSKNLEKHWGDLDNFEGEAYQRVLTKVTLVDGTSINAYVYCLGNN